MDRPRLHRLDRIDIVILRELAQAQTVLPARPGLRASNRKIAASVGVSAGTVRNRLRRLAASGVLTGTSVYPNPNLLGLSSAAYALDVAPQRNKREVVERLRQIDGVLFLQNFRGSLVGMLFVYPEGESMEGYLDRFDAIAGAQRGVAGHVQFPPIPTALTRPDRALISRVMQERFATYQELADDLHMSVRTVKRRLGRLATGYALLSMPTLNYGAIGGDVPANLIATFEPELRSAANDGLLQLVGDHLIFAGVSSELGVYNLILPNAVLGGKLAERAAHVPGVKSVRAELVDEHFDLTQNLARRLG
jgi:DNA-binding Lrp family transcriptional regulator